MQRIELNNFRVFGSPADFDLAPVTVLTGKNNSGKSSLIKAFLVLADYLEQNDQTVLRLDGPRAEKHKINNYEQLKNWSRTNLTNVTLGYSTGEFDLTYEFDQHENSQRLALFRFTVLLRTSGEKLELERLSRTNGSYQLSVRKSLMDYLSASDEERQRVTDSASHDKEVTKAMRSLVNVENWLARRESLESFTIEELEADEDKADAARDFQEMDEKRVRLLNKVEDLQNAARLDKESASIYILAQVLLGERISGYTIPALVQLALEKFVLKEKNSKAYKFQSAEVEKRLLRAAGKRVKELMNCPGFHLGPNRTYQSRLIIPQQGSEISTIVESFMLTGVSEGSTADIFLTRWLKEFDIGQSVLIEPIEQMAFKIIVLKGEHQVNLADLGYGAGQLLTVLLHIAAIIQRLENESTTRDKRQTAAALAIIEEPEANLHPQLQSLLAQLFLETARDYPILFLLETHSEYLIRKLQFLVASGQHQPEEVILHYLDLPESRHIRILPDGKLSQPFGAGFFDEAGNEMLALHRLQRKSQLS